MCIDAYRLGVEMFVYILYAIYYSLYIIYASETLDWLYKQVVPVREGVIGRIIGAAGAGIRYIGEDTHV